MLPWQVVGKNCFDQVTVAVVPDHIKNEKVYWAALSLSFHQTLLLLVLILYVYMNIIAWGPKLR